MAWNEPGGNGKDPWGNRQNDGPPDLDEFFSNLQKKLSGLFGGKGGGGSQGGGFGAGLGLVLPVIAIAWALFGIYIVDADERGVVLQFGRHVDTTMPGPHWYPPIIQSVEIVSVSNVKEMPGRAEVLTGDENIVHVEYTVQYNVKSASDYVFNVNEPDKTLEQAAESAFREVIGKNTLDYVVKDGRDEVSISVAALLQDILDSYGAGLDVNRVNLSKSQPPPEVQAALDDANKAREDKERYIREAEAYSNDLLPKARGDAQEQIERAKGYRVSLIKSAEGEAKRFMQLLAEYERAPKVTRERLYLETMEVVLANSGKVMVDVEGGNNMMYLPLDQIMGNRGRVTIEPISKDQHDQITTDTNSSSSIGRRSREAR